MTVRWSNSMANNDICHHLRIPIIEANKPGFPDRFRNMKACKWILRTVHSDLIKNAYTQAATMEPTAPISIEPADELFIQGILQPNSSAAIKTKEPTTFFSLPPELRQVILSQSYDFKFVTTPFPVFDDNFDIPQKAYWDTLCLETNRQTCKEKSTKINVWIRSLRAVHRRLLADVDYVLAKWLKKLDGIKKQAEDDSTMQEHVSKPADTAPKKPATFLTLPRELRQKILYYSCSIGYTDGKDLQLKLQDPMSTFEHQLSINKNEKFRFRMWARVLTKAIGMDEEVGFVEKKWEKEVDVTIERCVKKEHFILFWPGWNESISVIAHHLSKTEASEIWDGLD
ncbi:hypothetical protein FKW77_001869 [Venturia effusa]|uniref:Uncharacterized protein n=1 Tax=Venturia effusa TaxID=50376 RepID=A0A517L8R8_9PEZI|nr:hypothetical protein FKW77_001869 [Venturia effusa]